MNLYEWMWERCDWRVSSGNMKGNRYTLDAFPMVKDVLKDDSREQVVMKSAQLAASEVFSLARPFFMMDHHRVNWGVLFPTQGAMRNFFKTRFKGAIAANQYINRRTTSSNETNIDSFDRTVFLRYTTTEAAIATFDADGVTVDELDIHNQNMIYGAKTSRTQGAMGDVYWHEISTPTYPNIGIHLSYLSSDQHVWLIRCGSCNYDNDLTQKIGEWKTEDMSGFIDDYLGSIPNWKDYHIPCSRCGGALEAVDPMSKLGDRGGRWVAKYPDRFVRGYHMQIWNRAYKHGTAHVLQRVRDQYLKADKPEKVRRFYNSTVGVPYIPAEGRLSDSAIAGATTHDFDHLVYTVPGMPNLMAIRDTKVDYMGVDVRDEQFHIWGMRRIADNRKLLVMVGWVSLSGEVTDLWRRFGNPGFAIDNEPDTNESRAMVKAMDPRGRRAFRGKLGSHMNRVWQDSGDRHMKMIHRAKCMEEVKAMVENSEWVVPRPMWEAGSGCFRAIGINQEEETVRDHFQAPVMVQVEDLVTGNIAYEFPKQAMGGIDPHFFMAACFCHIASESAGTPSGIILVPR